MIASKCKRIQTFFELYGFYYYYWIQKISLKKKENMHEIGAGKED